MTIDIKEATMGIDSIIDNLENVDARFGVLNEYRDLMIATLLVMINQRMLTKSELNELGITECEVGVREVGNLH